MKKLIAVILFSACLFFGKEARATTGDFAHWRFDENSGIDTTDALGLHNLHFGGNASMTWIPGKYGTANSINVRENHTWQLSQALTSDLEITDSFTVGGWIKTGDTTTQDHFIMWWGDTYDYSGTPANVVQLVMNNGGHIVVRVKVNNAQNDTTAPTNQLTSAWGGYNDNQWHHVAIRINKPTWTIDLFVDGLPDQTQTLNNAYIPKLRLIEFGRPSGYYTSRDMGYMGALDDWFVTFEYLTNSHISQTFISASEFSFTQAPPPMCTAWSYTEWTTCGLDHIQTREIISATPEGCDGGMPYIQRSCDPTMNPQSDYFVTIANPLPDSTNNIALNIAGPMSLVLDISYVTPQFWLSTSTRPTETIAFWEIFDKGLSTESYQLKSVFDLNTVDPNKTGKFKTTGATIDMELNSSKNFMLELRDDTDTVRAAYRFSVTSGSGFTPLEQPTIEECLPDDSLFYCAIKMSLQKLFLPTENTQYLISDIKNIIMGRWFFGYIQTGLDNIKTTYSSIINDGAKAGIKYDFSLKGKDFDLGNMTVLDTTDPTVAQYAELMRPYMIAVLWILFFIYVFWRVFYFDHL